MWECEKTLMQRQREMGRVERTRKRERRERRSAHQPGPSGSASGGNELKYKIQISKIQKERGGKWPSSQDLQRGILVKIQNAFWKNTGSVQFSKKGRPKISEIQNSREVKLKVGQAGTCDLEVGNFPAKLSKAPPSSLGGSLCLLCLEAKKYTHETNTYYTQPYHPSKVKENTPSTHPTLK